MRPSRWEYGGSSLNDAPSGGSTRFVCAHQKRPITGALSEAPARPPEPPPGIQEMEVQTGIKGSRGAGGGLSLWVLVALAVFPAEQPVGGIISDDTLFFAVPVDASSVFHREHPEERHVG